MHFHEVIRLMQQHYTKQPAPKEFFYFLRRESWRNDLAVSIYTGEPTDCTFRELEVGDGGFFQSRQVGDFKLTIVDLFSKDWTLFWTKLRSDQVQEIETAEQKGAPVSEGQPAKDSRSVNVSNYKELFSEIGPNLTKICMVILEEAKGSGMTPSKAKFLSNFTEHMFAMIKLMG